MSFGLIAINDSRYVQVDSDNPRLCALFSGSYAASGSRSVTITFPSPVTTDEPPCVFIRNSPEQPDVLYSGMYLLGAARNWTGFRLDAGNTAWRPVGKWFAATFAPRPTARWGLRMWDGAGNVVYDSGTTPVLVTKATNSWSYQGVVQLTLGSAYYYRAEVTGAIAIDEYFMINPFSRNLLAPQVPVSNVSGARFNYLENRLQLYSIGTTGWLDIGQPGVVFARLPGT